VVSVLGEGSTGIGKVRGWIENTTSRIRGTTATLEGKFKLVRDGISHVAARMENMSAVESYFDWYSKIKDLRIREMAEGHPFLPLAGFVKMFIQAGLAKTFEMIDNSVFGFAMGQFVEDLCDGKVEAALNREQLDFPPNEGDKELLERLREINLVSERCLRRLDRIIDVLAPEDGLAKSIVPSPIGRFSNLMEIRNQIDAEIDSMASVRRDIENITHLDPRIKWVRQSEQEDVAIAVDSFLNASTQMVDKLQSVRAHMENITASDSIVKCFQRIKESAIRELFEGNPLDQMATFIKLVIQAELLQIADMVHEVSCCGKFVDDLFNTLRTGLVSDPFDEQFLDGLGAIEHMSENGLRRLDQIVDALACMLPTAKVFDNVPIAAQNEQQPFPRIMVAVLS